MIESLVRARVLLGLNQAEAAKKAGITRVYYGEIERGAKRPLGPIVFILASCLGLDARVLWNEIAEQIWMTEEGKWRKSGSGNTA